MADARRQQHRVNIADHGRRPLPDGVIKVSRDFRKTVGIEKKTHEDCSRL